MTKKELIKILNNFDDDQLIYIDCLSDTNANEVLVTEYEDCQLVCITDYACGHLDCCDQEGIKKAYAYHYDINGKLCKTDLELEG